MLQSAERLSQYLVRNLGHQAAQFVEAASAQDQPVQADQAPFAAYGGESGGERALGGERRLMHIESFGRESSFHKVTGLPKSAFLLFCRHRASLMVESTDDYRNAHL
jgi:hypothetical protein